MSSHDRTLVSVIVPTYNEAADIARTMDALVSLAYESLEVVVVDDASQDGTLDIVRSYQERIPSLRILPQALNRGVAASRNVGLREAEGDIVVILNADVFPDPDFVEQILPHYHDGADYLLVNSKVANEGLYPRYIQAQHEYMLEEHGDLEWSEGYSCRRKAALEVGGFPEEFPGASGEDAVFGDRMRERFRRAADFSIVVPHVAPDSLTTFWSQRRGRGRGGAYRLHAFDKKPVRWGIALRSLLGTWLLVGVVFPALVYVLRLIQYSPRGVLDTLPFLWVRSLEMLAVQAGYWRGCREIAHSEASSPVVT